MMDIVHRHTHHMSVMSVMTSVDVMVMTAIAVVTTYVVYDDCHHPRMMIIVMDTSHVHDVRAGVSSRQKSRDTRTGVIPKAPKGLRLTTIS